MIVIKKMSDMDGELSKDQKIEGEDSLIPANWDEIATMRLALLDQDYQECVAATNKTDPDHFLGLEHVLS